MPTAILGVGPRHVDYDARERVTRLLRVFEASAVLGLLQCEDYARAIVACGHFNRLNPQAVVEEAIKKDVEKAIEEQVAFRLGRQKQRQLTGTPTIDAILLQSVLDSLIAGDRNIAIAQLEHLIEASKQPGTELRVLLHGATMLGANGSFYLMSGGGCASAVYEEGWLTSRLNDDPESVAYYEEAFDYLGEKALDMDASRDYLQGLLDGLIEQVNA